MVQSDVISVESLFGDDAAILRQNSFQFLLLASALPVLGIALVSPILNSLVTPFGISASSIGLMISVFTAPAIIIIPFAGALADQFGRKPVLVVALLLFGVGGTAIAFTTDFRVVLTLRFIQGLGFGGLNPIIITSIGDLYTGDTEATGQGLRFMMSGLSGALSPIIAGLLVVVAWHYPFLLYTSAFLVAGMVYLWFDEPTATTSSVATGEREKVSYSRALFRLLCQSRVMALVLARTLMNGIWIGFLTYNSFIVVQLIGGTRPQSGLLAAVGFFVFALSASQAGRITSRFESPFPVLIGANIGLGVGFAVVLFASAIVTASLGISVSGIGFGLLGSLYRSLITDFAPEHLRAGLVSLSEMGAQLTNTLTPVLMGGLIAFATPKIGFHSALRLAGLCVAIVVSGGSIVCLLVAATSTHST